MANSTCKAVILAGGKGTRFHPFSFTIPKPLMPIGQDPILHHLMRRLQQSGVTEVMLALGYQSELIKAYFGTGERWGLKVSYFQEDTPLGTAGPLSLMRQCFGPNEYFYLANGDIYTELDFAEMSDFATQGGFDLVVGYVEKTEKSAYGVLEVHGGVIERIIEKPERRFSISAGIYVLNGRALEFIPDLKFFTMPDLMDAFFTRGLRVGAFPIRSYWLGIEDVESMEQVMQRMDLGLPNGLRQ